MKPAIRHLARQAAALAGATLLVTACGGEPKASTGRDRGSASMQMDGASWVADSAKWRINGSRLSLDIARSHTEGTVTTRDQVKLSVPDYDGPGTYTVGPTSMFVSVKVDSAKFRDAEATEEETLGHVKGAVEGTDVLTLIGAKVVVTSADGDEIEGTYDWTGPNITGGADRPLTRGKFRAKMR